jgi:hypothetical protein
MSDNAQIPNGAINALRVFAWFMLVIFAGCAIAIWADLGTRPIFAGARSTEANPFGVVLGVLVAISGMGTCAFFLTVALIAESVLEIRRELTKKDAIPSEAAPESKNPAAVTE